MTVHIYTHCIVCGSRKQLPKQVSTRNLEARGRTVKRASAYASRVTYESDPYCSTECCRLDHAIDDRGQSTA